MVKILYIVSYKYDVPHVGKGVVYAGFNPERAEMYLNKYPNTEVTTYKILDQTILEV